MKKTLARRLARYALTTTMIAGAVATMPPAALGQARIFDIPAQPLSSALSEFSRQSGVMIAVAPELTQGKRSRAVKGGLPANVVIGELLRGSGLRAVPNPSGGYRIEGNGGAPARETSEVEAEESGAEIVVTGSHIRGAPVAAQVVTVTQQDMKNSGFSNLGEVARSLPQSFGGGQNPGVNAPGLGNTNINGASSLNLRGLGADATLTLLNGHRLPYNGAFQAVDISAIPAAAVDRLEVVADGASAIYGSDAVGGVANVILKRDFDGLYTSARRAGSTDGGNQQQQYTAVAGTTWATGGFIIAVDYDHATPINAAQRDYTPLMDGLTTLMPNRDAILGIVSAHQFISPTVELRVDILAGRRKSTIALPWDVGSSYRELGNLSRTRLHSLSVAPSLEVELSRNWTLNILGTYGRDDTNFNTDEYISSDLSGIYTGIYYNRSYSGELNAQGVIAELPSGEAKVSFGGGFRRNDLSGALTFNYFSFVVNGVGIEGDIKSYYGYGEISLPLLSKSQDSPLGRSLFLSAAARYENYPGRGDVVTPKLGLIYEPVDGVTIKGSWGQSFKAPTLYSSHNAATASIKTASQYASTSLTPTTPVVELFGGNRDLRAERAETWSFSATLQPGLTPGLTLEAGFFNVIYRDRAVDPLRVYSGALENIAYAEFVTLAPTLAQVNDAILLATGGVQNFTRQPFDPATVGAIVDNRYHNALRQRIRGVDLSASYKVPTGRSQSLQVSALASYLESNQDLVGIEVVQLAGEYANPPHWRGRGGATWASDRISLSAFMNYIGASRGRLAFGRPRIDPMTTIDLTARLASPKTTGILRDVALDVSVLNVADVAPSYARPAVDYMAPYDTTSQSPLGRVVAVTLSKTW